MDKKKGDKIVTGLTVFKTILEGLWLLLKIAAVIGFVLLLIYLLKQIPDFVSGWMEVVLYGH